jgi:hypothetical protein
MPISKTGYEKEPPERCILSLKEYLHASSGFEKNDNEIY